MPRISDTRERLLEASAALFRRQGYTSSGLKQIVHQAGAPWGSLYHFFPGGKEQLAAQAIRRSGQRYETLIETVFARTPDPADAVRAFIDFAIDALERSDFADGCPIGTVAFETAHTSETLREACAEVFSRWNDLLASKLTDPDLHEQRAHELATHVITTFEGAILLSRVRRDSTPLRTAADILADILRR